MMLPTLISVSVAPGSYFFWACAVVAAAIATSPASAIVLAWLKTRWCITVLPDVLADGSCSLDYGAALVDPSDRMHLQYARFASRCQQRLCCYFSATRKGPGSCIDEQGRSNAATAGRA